MKGSDLSGAKLAIIGLGYVGLPLAVEFGKKYPTVGFDVDASRIAALQNFSDKTMEVTAAEIKASSELVFTSDPSDLQSCNIYIVTVPTPIDHCKRPNLEPLVAASRTVGRVIRQGDLVIYESTVYPGCTEEVCVPILEQESGLVFNKDFYCGYSPERINPGDRQHRISDIKKVTSGSNDEISFKVDALYSSVINAGTHRASSIRVAEAAKVIENTQRDLNIALMNELSLIFERLEIDTNEVLQAAGTKWNFLPFKPGLVGGHCIGVDPYYLTYKAESVGYSPHVILAGRRINDGMAQHVASTTIRLMLRNGMDLPRCEIGVLGLSFKENCPDVRNSKVVDMLREFAEWGCRVRVFDPWVEAQAVQASHGIELEEIDEQRPVDALVVAVGHEQFAGLQPRQLRAMVKGQKPVLVDVKGLYEPDALRALGFTLFRL